ncbi:hypothetical protein OG765_25170 [Streptomyces sp. NBC_00555]|uniref:hypothetical protein n=1 Tax=Streptomyces sp. NBC_00555 TaxID=2903662 RepID=UPI0022572B93|nr:hypothetical protein [Streptomyces sp. NBC_00555]MCX5014251.1 hypothetical protein [Streptomyces sp. NBC_00555]
MDSSSAEVKSALGKLDQQRRDQVSRQIEATQPPDLIRSVQSSEVTINIDPDVLPYEDMDYDKFVEEMRKRYRLRLDTSDLEVLIKQTQNTPGAATTWDTLSDGEKARISLSATQTITFKEGKFPGLGRDEYTAIYAMAFHSQNLAAKVHGPTAIAELLVKEAFELACDAAAIPRKWESEGVQREVALKSYGTHTKVDLGLNVLGVIAPEFRAFIEQNLGDNLSLGAKMMARSALDGFNPPSKVAGTVVLDDLILKLSVLDLQTGRTESPRIQIRAMSLDEMGRGIVDIISALPFEDHVKLIEGLADALRYPETALQ